MSGGFGFNAEALSSHAVAVDELTERLQRVAAAATPLGLSAYGVIGQVFAMCAVAAADSGAAAIEDVARQAAALGESMRAARRMYVDVEDVNVAVIGGVDQ